MLRPRSIQERFSRRQTLIGLLQMRVSPLLVEMAGECGYDFILLDGEHGVFSEDEFAHSLRALAATDVLALARIAGHDTGDLRRYLDWGADVIVVPQVATAEEARALARAMDSQPRRSLIVIIESALGVASAEEILAVDGVDGALVGPNDLTQDLGCKGDYAHPAFAEALSQIERAAALTGKFLGTVPTAAHSLEALSSRGHRFFVLGSDRSLLRAAMSAQATDARSRL